MNGRKYPISPVPDDDPRFDVGFILDVNSVLVDHGYPPAVGPDDFIRLRQTLYRFLYGEVA